MKNLKRILSYVMMVIMCVFLFSGVSLKKVLANERHNFNTNKGTLSYEISDNNEITIVEYSGRDTELEIPASVEYIGEGAFCFLPKLKEVLSVYSTSA